MRVPEPVPGTIERHRLTHLLEAGESGKPTLVAAPAGWGKTTAVVEWARSFDRPVAWVGCERRLDEPGRLWGEIHDAIASVTPADRPVGLRAAPDVGEQRLCRGLEPLLAARSEVVLVLDNFQVIESSDVLDGVAELVGRVPGSLRLVLVTRADPLLALYRARLAGGITEIRAKDLAFTTYETSRLLEEHNLSFSGRDVERLCTRVEGWATGLRLAVSAIEPGAESSAMVDAIVDAGPAVTGYLAEQVIGQLDADDRTLLMR
ncbi:MAG: AAA family ATPase, partial [Actinomycetes bacterium]